MLQNKSKKWRRGLSDWEAGVLPLCLRSPVPTPRLVVAGSFECCSVICETAAGGSLRPVPSGTGAHITKTTPGIGADWFLWQSEQTDQDPMGYRN